MARKPAASPSISPAAPAVHVPAASRPKVTVGCKLAVSRFELQLCGSRTVTEQTQAGPREITQYFRTGEVWVVRGTAYPEGTPPKGFIKRPEEVDGAVLTRGIPADFFAEWMRQYAKSDMVKNGLIFAHESDDYIEGIAAELKGNKCAFSPLDMPERTGEAPADTRVPRSVNANVGNIEKMAT